MNENHIHVVVDSVYQSFKEGAKNDIFTQMQIQSCFFSTRNVLRDTFCSPKLSQRSKHLLESVFSSVG